MKSWKLLLILTGASIATLAHAQIYQWTDEKGQTHYSDSTPKAGKTKDGIQQRENNLPGITQINTDAYGNELVHRESTYIKFNDTPPLTGAALAAECDSAKKEIEIPEKMHEPNKLKIIKRWIEDYCKNK